jgi:hypothetical protein
MEDLPRECDLNSLDVRIGKSNASACYIGPPDPDGLQQVNVLMPAVERTGLLPTQVLWNGRELCQPKWLRVVPPAPAVPFVVSITDGIDVLAKSEVVTGTVKVTIEEAAGAEAFSATVDGIPVYDIDVFCADPRPPRYEINFSLPKDLREGVHSLQMSMGNRALGVYPITVTKIP